ncbi:MAG TPA: LysM peptidoglycan-binding domain-containing protein [Oculatellaceae cyanobacterium]
MSPSAFNLNGFRPEAALQTGADLGHAAASPLIENQLSSPADIGRAHQFFQPQIGNAALSQAAVGKAAIGNAALGQAMLPGGDATSLAAKAMQMAQAQVSPIIQLIMRMPGHIGLMSSAFEAFANFFTHHAELIGGLDPSLLGAAAHGDIGAQLADAAPIGGEHMALDLNILPHDAPILHDLSLHDGLSESAVTAEAGGSFDLSYVNEHLFSHESLNVSGSVDLAKPQYEGLSFNDPHGEVISGPSMSHASPATHLADDKSLMLEKGFGLNHAGHSSTSLASSSATSQPVAPVSISASSNTLPSNLHVGSSAFGSAPSAQAAVGNLNTATADSGSLSNALGGAGGDSGAFGPSGAISDKLGGQQLLAMNKPDTGAYTGGSSEYGANFIKQQPSGTPTEGLKAKELTLESVKDSVKGAHKLDTPTHHSSHSDVADKISNSSHEVAKHSANHTAAHSAHKVASAAKPAASSGTASNAAPSFGKPQEIANAQGAGAQATPATDTTQGTDGAQATDAGSDYTVKSGDCLWNIAKDKLGDATKWTEIYKLNSDTLGSNPSLIHTGTTIHLPGQSIAHAGEATKYVVKSGDNLWNISKSHLGDATKWGDVYKLNHDVIGANPSLIRPGTELTLPGSPDGASGQLADASGATTAAPGAGGEVATTAAAPQVAAPEQVAQAVPDQNIPAAFGHPNGAAPVEAHPAGTGVAETHLPPQSLDTSLPPSGAATAAPAVMGGPGAAGAATLAPVTPVTPFVPANSPENASVVSSSVSNDLASFLSRKK